MPPDVHTYPFCRKHTLDVTGRTFTIQVPATVVFCSFCELDTLRALRDLVRDELAPIVEMDDEANDPGKDLYAVLMRAKMLIEESERPPMTLPLPTADKPEET